MKYNLQKIKEAFISNGYKFFYKQFKRDFYLNRCCESTLPVGPTQNLRIVDLTNN